MADASGRSGPCVDTVQQVEQVDGIGRIRASAPELDQHRAQIVLIGSEPRTGASPIVGTAITIALLHLWPPCGAVRHLGVSAWLMFRDSGASNGSLYR